MLIPPAEVVRSGNKNLFLPLNTSQYTAQLVLGNNCVFTNSMLILMGSFIVLGLHLNYAYPFYKDFLFDFITSVKIRNSQL